MSWKLDSVSTKYDTAKGVLQSTAKFNLWDEKTEIKVAHKSKTDDISFEFKTKKPFEFEIEHDLKPKNTKIKSEIELFNDKLDLKLEQKIPGNKWSVVPSPLIQAEFEPSEKFESGISYNFSTQVAGAKLKSKMSKKHEVTCSAEMDSKLKPKELKAEYEFKPHLKWCDELEVMYSTVKGLELEWETKPSKSFKTELKGNLKTKKVSAQLEWKTQSKKPMLKSVLSLGCPIDNPQKATVSATFQAEYKF
mmetsp:Transcript_8790/g.21243  ORF Transcript_8790/g.21243 Transcript_8790/m.21243 type:complete len:249 (-) Transcript_8790:57-803(-)